MKKLILSTILSLLMANMFATEAPMLTATKNNNVVTISTHFEVKANETYEIQKSTDSKIFTTIAVVMGTEDAENMPAFSMKDKANATAKQVQYRVVKVNTDNSITVLHHSNVTL